MGRKPNIVAQISERVAEKSAEKFAEKMLESEGVTITPETAERIANNNNASHTETFDIFSHCEKEFAEKGDFITYYIRKNGAFLTQHDHPFSWNELQAEHGGGVYNIIARSGNLARIVKQQTQRVHPPANGSTIPQPEQFSFSDAPQATQAPMPQAPSMSEILALMEAQSEKQARLARESREQFLGTIGEIAKNFAPIIAAVLTKPAVNPEGSSNEMFKLMFEMLRENQRSTNEQVRSVIDEVKRTQVPQAQPNVFDLISKLRQDDESMLDRALKVQEVLNAKAAEIAESRMCNNGDEDDTTKLLLKTLLPIVGGLGGKIVANKIDQANQPPVPLPSEPKQPVVQAVVQSTAKPLVSKPIVQNTQKPITPKPITPSAVIPINSINGGNEMKKKILTLLLPYLKETLIKMQTGTKVEASTAGAEIVELLKKHSISASDLISAFKQDDLIKLARSYNLPTALDPWFNGMYEYINHAASMADRQ